jgi:hypothetical protein
MNYADHERDRTEARVDLKKAILAEIVARYEGLTDKAGIDPVGIALAVLDYEEAHWIETRDGIVGEMIRRYPEAVDA